MPRGKGSKTPRVVRRGSGATKYDAHHSVLSSTYGMLAALRRELSDSKSDVAEREVLLKGFATCTDPQRSWLMLEDYFEKLSLSRKDFPDTEWWPSMLAAQGKARLEQLAFLFLRAHRTPPTELAPHANSDRFAQAEAAEREKEIVKQLEAWIFPHAPTHLDAPRAHFRVICEPKPDQDQNNRFRLAIQMLIQRQRVGEKPKTTRELVDLTTRAAHEEELFPPEDWEVIDWVSEVYRGRETDEETIFLSDLDLLHWLARWGNTKCLETPNGQNWYEFHGQVAELVPTLDGTGADLGFSHQLKLPDESLKTVKEVRFFPGRPALVLVDLTFYLLRNAPPSAVLQYWTHKTAIPVRRLSQRLVMHLRKHQPPGQSVSWDQLCIVHSARPQYVFELLDEVVQLRLMAKSERDESLWIWNGHDWQPENPARRPKDKPEFLDDPRLEPATAWLRKLDWFTPEPGLWVGDANEHFLNILALAWSQKPADAEYLGNPGFHQLFLSPRRLKPRLVVRGSGIDWLSVSTEWEEEGLKLTPADLERLARASGRFVKLPNAGWVELDTNAVQSAQEAMADLGVDGLAPVPQKIGLENAAHLDENGLNRFGDSPQAHALRERLKNFKGVPDVKLPVAIKAELRPYQKEGFDFLCHLTNVNLGGILADDMGLGKTLQTLTWLAWLRARQGRNKKPALVICPASVLHNWRREAERFVPDMKVLVLQSGAARHNLRKQIPDYDIIVTNYALLRRDLEELQKFDFGALVLDEAQFIKNPEALVTQSVKQLESDHRLALTGTPLENRLLDLWSIADFIQPGYLGTEEYFAETYDPRDAGTEAGGDENARRIGRRRLAAKIRPLMLRRLKRQVAKDLPDRIEQRRDCELGDDQRKLYLAELRRSRDEVFKAVSEKGLNKSKLMVLAALTRLRQICCHPRLVGSDAPSGKTETLLELLEPLVAEGQKVLVFSQFVQMLELLQRECNLMQYKTHILTGQTKQRQEVVAAFQSDPDPSVFLLSLRAAGTGLNLTAASYVILYDPWWNPAVEAQAIDRSHRIGQTQTVNAYRLISPGTVEEKIWNLQQSKAQTIADVLGEEGFARSLSSNDLEYLFSED
jgi:SNF2 family DNA or RNA helicase